MFSDRQVSDKEIPSPTNVKRLRLSLKSHRNRVVTVEDSSASSSFQTQVNVCQILAEDSIPKEQKLEPLLEEETLSKSANKINSTEVCISSLKNLGNTCYLNSVLYCLLYIKEFRKIVHEAYVKLQLTYSDCNRIQFPTGSADVVLQLHETFRQMIKIKLKDATACDQDVKEPGTIVFKCTVLEPIKLLDSLRNKNSMFEGNLQNDAHDALSCIMRCLETVDDQKSPRKKTRKKGSTSFDDEQLTDMFRGELLMKTKCLECENWSTTKENFTEVSIPTSLNTLDFESALKMEEMLRDDEKYWCNTCHHSNEAVRLCEYLQFPPVLTINLKPRYAQYTSVDGFQKTSTNSAVPEQLSCLNDTCQPKPCTNKSHKFVLLAVICHIGSSLASGHFTSYIRGSVMYDKMDNLNATAESFIPGRKRVTRNDAKKTRMIEKMNQECCDPPEGPTLRNEWVYFDDEHVKIVSQLPSFGGGVSTETPYLLFYRNLGDS